MRFASFLLTGILAFTGLSCSEDPLAAGPTGPRSLVPAGAFTETTSMWFPVNFLAIPCIDGEPGGEVVELTGDLHVVFHVTVNGNRVFVKSHFRNALSGVGPLTGDKYVLREVYQYWQSGSLVNGQLSYTVIVNSHIIGQGSGNNSLHHQTFHITVNANGEVTATFSNGSGGCR